MTKTTYRIVLNVEFQRGQVSRIEWENDSIQWSRLDNRVRRKSLVRVRKDHFSFDVKVRDVTAGLFDPVSGRLSDVTDPTRIHPESLVFILESPHKDEYYVNSGIWTAREPLYGSRDMFREHLRSVLEKFSLSAPIRVVLCNPIQWQTSLHRFYLPKVRTGRKWPLQAAIRNQIWCHLWRYSIGEQMPIQLDFAKRLLDYNPKIVINACSAGFRVSVGLIIGYLQFHPYTVNHPSGWYSATNRVLSERWHLATDEDLCERLLPR